MLGHLGLAQIGRTGERGRERALIGVTLSYMMITVAVVALVVYAVSGPSPGPTTIATTPTTARPTATTPAPSTGAPPTSAPSPAPSPAAVPSGPTLPAANPPTPLLSLDEIKTILGTTYVPSVAPPAIPVPDLAAYPQVDNPPMPPTNQGSVNDTQCAPMLLAGTAAAYDGTGYTAFHQVTMAQPGPDGTQSVTEVAAFYDSPAAANAALAGMIETVNLCKKRKVTVTSASSGKTYSIDINGAAEEYTFTGPEEQKVYMADVEESYSSTPYQERFTVQHGWPGSFVLM